MYSNEKTEDKKIEILCSEGSLEWYQMSVGFTVKAAKCYLFRWGPITLWQAEGEDVETVILFSLAPKSLWMVTAVMKLKDTSSLEGKLWQT